MQRNAEVGLFTKPSKIERAMVEPMALSLKVHGQPIGSAHGHIPFFVAFTGSGADGQTQGESNRIQTRPPWYYQYVPASRPSMIPEIKFHIPKISGHVKPFILNKGKNTGKFQILISKL
jgi:hypothetical protein